MISGAAEKAKNDICHAGDASVDRFLSGLKGVKWLAWHTTFYVMVEATTECGKKFKFKVGRATGPELFSRLVTVNIYYEIARFFGKK